MWIKIDKTLSQKIDIDSLKDDIDDIGELLMFFQDIFELGIPALTKALTNSLMYLAYYPAIFASIDPGKNVPEINQYSATIFFLTQTYNYIKDPLFINTLSTSLFIPYCHPQLKQWIENPVQ